MEILSTMFIVFNFIMLVLSFYMLCNEYHEHKKRTEIIKKCTIDSPELEYLFSSLEESSHNGLWLALISIINIAILYL